MRREGMSEAFEAPPIYDIFDKQRSYQLSLPTGDEDVFVVRGKNLPKANNPRKDILGNFDNNQALLVAELVSSEVGVTYDVAGIQTLDEQFCKGGEVKDDVLVPLWAHARQRARRVADGGVARRLVFDYPVARVVGEKIYVFGTPSEPKPDEGGVAKTFGVTLNPETYDYGVAFENNNGIEESSARADWPSDEGRLGVFALWPSDWGGSCLVLEKRQVA